MTDRIVKALLRRQVGGGDVARAAVALPLLVSLDALLRAFGLRRTQRLVGSAVPLRRQRGGVEPAADPRTGAFVLSLDRAGVVFRPGVMCLRRSLAIWAWLRWWGIDSTIVLGVRRDSADGMAAHAWVEQEGVPLYEPVEAVREYVPFGSLAASRRLR